MRVLPWLCLAACAAPPAPRRPEVVPGDWSLLLAEDFEGSAPRLDCTDAGAFRIAEHEGGHVLELHRAADYEPPVRSPRAIALLSDLQLGDFLLEADLQQTGREYGHRDLCLFFCYQAPDRYYYVHLASRADEHAHNLFVVDRAPRRAFASRTTAGIDWGRETWHRVRLLRRAGTGEVRVWFDGEEVMAGRHAALQRGRIGFGSFDDTGRIDNLRIWGPPQE